MKSIIALVLSLPVLVGGATGYVPESAPVFDLSDPTTLMTKLAPEEIEKAAASYKVRPAESGLSAEASKMPIEGFVVDAPQNMSDMTIRVAAGQKDAGLRDGYRVYKTDQSSSATYVKPTSNGAQVIFGATAPDSLKNFLISFNSKIVGHSLRPDGSLSINFSSGPDILVNSPWAKDADGNSLPTNYVVSGDSVIQKVYGISGDTRFPIIADPNWGYRATYDLGTVLTVENVRDKLKNCFNCTFPVDNAPANYPSPGQLLPLTAGFGPITYNFNCTFRGDYSVPGAGGGLSYWGFNFDATKDHVDGLGSVINFEIGKPPVGGGPRAGHLELSVYASIVNNDPLGPPLGQFAYTTFANTTWATFTVKIRAGVDPAQPVGVLPNPVYWDQW